MKKYTKAVLILGTLFCLTATGQTQSTETPQTTQTDSVSSEPSGEITFDEIVIEGTVEKPNVAILPTRERTEFGEIDFVNRSFSSEVKALPARSFILGTDSGKPTPLTKSCARLIKLKKR